MIPGRSTPHRRGRSRIIRSQALRNEQHFLSGEWIHVFSNNQTLRISVGQVGEEAQLMLMSPEGKPQIGIVASEGQSNLPMFDSCGHKKIAIGVQGPGCGVQITD